MNNVIEILIGFFIFGMFISEMILGFRISEADAYKRGQIDCINNVIKYELVEQDNKEKVWKEKSE